MITKTLRRTPDIHPIKHVRVVDGDTLEASIVLPFDTLITKRIRLKGWWADELEGQYAARGREAKRRLEIWTHEKVLWLHAPSCRLDKYGRVVGHLCHDMRIISAREVLGDLQLTEAVHKERSDRLRALRGIAARTVPIVVDHDDGSVQGLESGRP